jgi:pyruvyl transferase EpsO
VTEAARQTPAAPEPLVPRLIGTIDATLRPLLADGRPAALLDFPVYPNVGDSAIWLGTLSSLHRLGIHRLSYVCSFLTYSREELARRIGDGCIVLSGGGNFGDAYEPHQRLREEVIAAFPNNPVLQLPQSIWYQNHEAIERTRRVLEGHSHFTLLLRDRASLEFAAREFPGVTTGLCPDMAFGLGTMRSAAPPSQRVVWLARTDSEALASGPIAIPDGVVRVDWGGGPRTPFERFATRVYARIRARAAVMNLFHAWLARLRLLRGVRMLGGARLVITDRLHAHVLCLLLGIPHCLLPNRNGKVRALYEAWTRESPLARWCDSPAEALEIARDGRS